MAGITGTVRDIQSGVMFFMAAPSWIYFNDGYAPATSGGSLGVIHPTGVVPFTSSTVEVPGTDTKLYLVHVTHSTVGAYETLATTPSFGVPQTDSCLAGTLANCTIEEWATNAGVMDGKSINAGQTMDFSISARRETSTSEDGHLELEFYRRRTGGTETLLDTVALADLTTSYQDFTGTWSVSSDRAFEPNELLVLKIILHNDGTPL